MALSIYVLQSTQAAVTKYCRLGSLSTTEMDFLQFWRLESQDQSAGWFGSAESPLLIDGTFSKKVEGVKGLSGIFL
jgi:hypothetical protein